jgi:hypothetical protein
MTGLSCEVCGTRAKNPSLFRICPECHRIVCAACVRRLYLCSKDYSRLRWSKFSPKYREVCSDCHEELQAQQLEDQVEEKPEASGPITTCEICGSNDEPPDHKIFGYRPPQFLRCDRCGKLVCDSCNKPSPEGHYEYGMICSQCYDDLAREDEREREESRREALEEESAQEK